MRLEAPNRFGGVAMTAQFQPSRCEAFPPVFGENSVHQGVVFRPGCANKRKRGGPKTQLKETSPVAAD